MNKLKEKFMFPDSYDNCPDTDQCVMQAVPMQILDVFEAVGIDTTGTNAYCMKSSDCDQSGLNTIFDEAPYFGKGALWFDNDDSKLLFNLDNMAAGPYKMKVRYSNIEETPDKVLDYLPYAVNYQPSE